MDIRAYSLLTLKAVNEEKREIVGIASTPTSDRMNDIVLPEGAKFTLPIPLLWQHDVLSPIGEVYEAKVTKNGIEVKARLAKILEPSQLFARLEEAWQSIKTGLVRGLSIGFRPLEYSYLDDGGMKILKWDWYELSAVTIPAQAEASITNVKSFDTKIQKAASGRNLDEIRKSKPSGVSEKNNSVFKLTPKEGNKHMDLQEQIKQYRAELSHIDTQLDEILKKSANNGETPDAADEENEIELEAKRETVTKHLDRLQKAQKRAAETATPVIERAGYSEKASSEVRQGFNSIVRVRQNVEKGIAFARLARCKALSKIDQMPAFEIAQHLYPDDQRIGNILKAAVTAHNSSNTAALIGDEGTVFADFAEFLRPQTIIGKFGVGGIPSLRRIPFRTRLISQPTGGAGYWVGEGAAKPLTKFSFAGTTLEPKKVANIAVATMELLRDSSPSAEMLIRDSLVAAIRERLDTDFVAINKAVSATSPASITNSITAVTSSGSTADDIRCDVTAVMAGFIAANNAPTNGVWIMSATTALGLSLMTNALGQREFPDISMAGGFFAGLPAIVSEYVQSDSTGQFVILVNASDIYIADEGDVDIKMSDQASLQMLDDSASGAGAPTNNSSTSTATSLVSLWQTNSVAFLAERTINWERRRDAGVGVIDGVTWGSCNS